MPYRGKRNESSYIPLIAAKLAEILNTDITDIANVTNKNAEKIFGN
jgi:TatD DNase family protein